MSFADQAIFNIYPNARTCIGGQKAYDANSNEIDIDWDKVNAEILILQNQAAINYCKKQAKELIANCDWAMLPDVNISNRAEFEAYRTTLRNLILNPVANPVFPTEPQPVWV